MSLDLFDLTGKVAIITGASRGIGEAIALLLADKGTLCILVSRKIEALEAVAEKILELAGRQETSPIGVGRIGKELISAADRLVRMG